MSRLICLITAFSFLLIDSGFSQLERKRTVQNDLVELTFMAPRHINVFTVTPLSKHEFHYSIMHTFGTIDGGVEDLWGIDNGANIRFSFEYGFNSTFSLALGRSSQENNYDLSARFHLLKQRVDDSTPISLSAYTGYGVSTENNFVLNNGRTKAPSFNERSNITAGLMIARKFSPDFSAQVSPAIAYFFAPRTDFNFFPNFRYPNEQFYTTTALSARYKVNGRTALTAQYIPTIAGSEFHQNVAFGVDIETGGHVFQMYLTTSQALNDALILSSDNGSAFKQLRFGFNINRLFLLKKPS